MEIKTNLFLPGKNNERDARRKILEWLIQGDYTPDDILDKLIVLKFKSEYIPHYLFTVDWAAGWAAEVGHSHEVTYTEYETQYDDNGKSHKEPITKTKTEIRWNPATGQVGGREEVVIMATQCSHPLLLDIEKVCAKLWRKNQLEKLCLAPSADIEVQQPDLSVRVAYKERVSRVIDNCAGSEVFSAIPGEQIRNESYSLIRQDYSVTCVYLPIWNVAYKYADKHYHYCAKAWSSRLSTISGQKPKDNNRKQAINSLSTKYKDLEFAITMYVVLILLLFFGLIIVSFIYYEQHRLLGVLGYFLSCGVALMGIVIGFTGYNKVKLEKSIAKQNKSEILQRSHEVRGKSLNVALYTKDFKR